MKAYTVYQPYAYATVAGLKHYETRPRRTNIRGRVAVHAGKKVLRNHDLYTKLWEMTGHDPDKYTGSALYYTECGIRTDYGAVVGTVEIVDCVPVEEIMDKLTPLEMALGDYSPGRFAWVLENPVMFNLPIPARGQQGWWNWDVSGCAKVCGNSYRVITRLEKKPDRMGRKLFRYSDFRGNCRVPCTGDFWEKPCEKEDYENCDECVCNHCEFCPCEEETEEKT